MWVLRCQNTGVFLLKLSFLQLQLIIRLDKYFTKIEVTLLLKEAKNAEKSHFRPQNIIFRPKTSLLSVFSLFQNFNFQLAQSYSYALEIYRSPGKGGKFAIYYHCMLKYAHLLAQKESIAQINHPFLERKI